MKNKKKLICLYVFCDLVAALLAWICLYIFRKHVGEGYSVADISFQSDPKFIWGCVILPICWVLLHGFIGYYNKVYRKSRLDELVTTFGVSLFGVLIFFFAFILDDIIITPKDYLKYFLFLFTCLNILQRIDALQLILYGDELCPLEFPKEEQCCGDQHDKCNIPNVWAEYIIDKVIDW